jgi:hypothetical protein
MENDRPPILQRPESRSGPGLVDSYDLAHSQPSQLARLNPSPIADDPDHDTADETIYQEIYRQIP